ncbi:MAG: hypothetical protein JWM68_1751 [Verrucomicrobiales bacterium]|nr:hypothetical protein [Verrucomicrobiales bacterium]
MNPNPVLSSKPWSPALLCLTTLLCVPVVAPASVLFSDNFNTNSASLWTTNYAPSANSAVQQATFAFDYSTFGIPAAPGSTDTLGLRLRSNIPMVSGAEVTTRPAGVTSGLSLSPTGKNFGSNYMLSFYVWANFNGAANASGLADNANSEGGTHNLLWAVGTSGTVPIAVGNTTLVSGGQMDGIGFATTGDAGIVNDYRIYPKSGTIVPITSTNYVAGGAANTNALYTTLCPSVTAPVEQQALSTAEYALDASNTQAGSTQAGAFGFAWHKVNITKSNNIVTWVVDNTLLATYDASALTLGGNNIALSDSDVNGSTTRHPSLLFAVYDNLTVTDLPGLPKIGVTATNGNVSLSWTNTGSFALEYADSLSTPVAWTNATATLTTNSGTVSATVSITNSAQFFRLKQ